MKRLPALGFAVLVALAGCSTRVDVEKVPLGTEVEVTRQDGGVLRGTLAARDDMTVAVKVAEVTRKIPRDQITGMQVIAAAPVEPAAVAVVPPAVVPPSDVTLPPGTRLSARLDSAVGSDSSRVGDPVEATLTRALTVDGVAVVPMGSVLRGTVVAVRSAGKVKGRASLGLHFSTISVTGRSEPYAIAARVSLVAPATKRRDATKIGIPAVGGAIIGGLLGGKKGAVIGTAVGGGAGTAVVLSTRGRQVRLARGAALSLRLDQAVDVQVPSAVP